MTPRIALSLLLVAGCGTVKDEQGVDAAVHPIDSPGSATFTVKGTVTGFAGRNMVLQLDGANDLAITADGAFSFTTPIADATAYTVSLKSAPICPQRTCTLTNATGTIAGADANVTVTCALPRYRMVSQNWGDTSVRVTDDIGAIANNAAATPRIIVGAATTLTNSRLDSVAYDAKRDTVYAASHTVAKVTVFANAATATGNIAPTRTITIAGETAVQGIEVDAANDRLFVTSATKLYVLNGASALNGTVTAPVAIPLTNAAAISRDPINDRLYVGGDFTMTLYIFDNAGALTSASTPTKTVTWTGWGGPPAVAIDGCRDRLYLGSNSTSTSGYNMFAFDNASALTGAINPETAAQARLTIGQTINAQLDSSGALWYWPDSPTGAKQIARPELLTGTVTVTPDKTISAVVANGYGLDIGAY